MKPIVKITTNKNEVKVYSGNKVFLKDGTSFEIMMYNPTQDVILAKIELNGKSISESGLILKPGQRVFLERFLESTNKFKFSTYETDDSSESKKATASNGVVSVSFYKERTVFNSFNINEVITNPKPAPHYPQPGTPWWEVQPWNQPYWTNGNPMYYSNTSTGETNLRTCNFSADSLSDESFDLSKFTPISNRIVETGRVEQGEKSNQEFAYENRSFEMFTFHTERLQILPESQKPIEISQIRHYCTSCGCRKKNQSWKHCPQCGTAFDN